MIHFHIKHETKEAIKDCLLGAATGIIVALAIAALFLTEDWTW